MTSNPPNKDDDAQAAADAEYERYYPPRPAVVPLSAEDQAFYDQLYPPDADSRQGPRPIRPEPNPADAPRPAVAGSADEALYRAAYPEQAAIDDFDAKFPKGISTWRIRTR